jgi:hypothetical protein
MEDGFVWKCKCGHIEHGEMPEDCLNCFALNSFKRVPDDQIDAAVEGEVLSMQPGEEDDV